MSELPLSVIKELKGRFQNYIPLSLCTHRACSNATHSMDAFDTEIRMNEKGEIHLKQKTMSSAKDQFLTCIELTKIHKNFICGMVKYLVLDSNLELGVPHAVACAGMFQAFFSTIAARSDFTLDWESYREYMIEVYSSWIGWRDVTYGLIFDEGLFFKYKMCHLLPSVMDHLRLSGFHNVAGTQALSSCGRGHSSSSWANPNNGQGHFQQFPSFQHLSLQAAVPNTFPNPPTTRSSFRDIQCYLCGGQHVHRDHQGSVKDLVTSDQGKWVDKALGNKTVCISFNISPGGCQRASCVFSHTCSLCGNASHGCM